MRFAAIDFETASSARVSACSVGIAIIEDFTIVHHKEWLIRPPSLHFSPASVQVHGITPEMVADRPEFDQIWPEIEYEIGERILVAHNAAFDMQVLRATWTHYDLWPMKMQFVCSCSLSRSCWPKLQGHSLGALARSFGIRFRHHDAEEDALTAAKVVLKAAHDLNATSIEELMAGAQLRFGEVSPGSYISCRRIPQKRKRAKLVYVPDITTT